MTEAGVEMSEKRDRYENPLIERYASAEMSRIFSPDFKFRTWRRLWIALAEAQKGLGLDITDAQIAELEKFRDDINYDVARAKEKEFRHDVMAHIHAYGAQCPKAKAIIHLGATSAFVGDNTDLIQIREGLLRIKSLLVAVISALSKLARKYRALPTLGFTHFQPAQLTTVGKRACLWLQDLVLDYEDICCRLDNLRFRGLKGTTGTQASFLKLFDGDTAKVEKLDRHFDQALDINIVLTVEKLRHKAEATLHVSGNNLHADDVQEDMYAAIDGMVDKLDRQGKKHKEKIKSHRTSLITEEAV